MPVFDQGYQHWSGELSGHAWRWLAITRHGVRVGARNRGLRLFMFTAWTPALALAFALCVWGLLERKSTVLQPFMQVLSFLRPEMIADPHHYRLQVWTICYDFFLTTELRFAMILVLLVGPNLISQDLRFNALPLYFSRPLRRIDYFFGKLGVIFAFLARVILLPCLLAWVLGLLFTLDASLVRATLPLLLASLAYGVIITVSAGLLMLALSSLSRNSRYVALFWIGIWFISSAVGGILDSVDREQRQHAMYRSIRVESHGQGGPGEALRMQRQWEQAMQQAQLKFAADEEALDKRNWRPLPSYTANLSRIGDQLLGTNAAWESVGKLLPPEERVEVLRQFTGPKYPWTWSAAVLLGLFGLSAWILNTRVKSLDRLK